MLDQILKDHRYIEAMADEFEARVSERRPADFSEVSRIRWAFANALLRHMMVEDRWMSSQPPRLASRFDQASARRFQTSVTEHLTQWSIERMTTHWSDYRRTTLDLLSTLRSRIKQEELELNPLSARAECANSLRVKPRTPEAAL